MSRRATLNSTTAYRRLGLVDSAGVPLASSAPSEVYIPDLPLIEKDAFRLPPGIEARLCERDIRGDGPEIVLWHPVHQVSVCVPLACMDEVEKAARWMHGALPGRRRRAA
jgi:hypothetical protein